jgi:hypothetical protein
MKLFGGTSGQSAKTAAAPQKLSRRSSGLGELARQLEGEEPLTVLDLGAHLSIPRCVSKTKKESR